MYYRDRSGRMFAGNIKQDRFLKVLYGTVLGRAVMKILIRPGVSRFFGAVLNTEISAAAAKIYMKKHNIAADEFMEEDFKSWNEFFRRKLKDGKRSVNTNKKVLISPCDGKLTSYSIDSKGYFPVKNTVYSMDSLLKNKEIAEKYYGGILLVFRLTVDDYHRYCYVADGKKSENIFLKGVLHTVNPIAEERYKIYHENSREYSFLETDLFGEILMMEVGAMLVGKIVNHHNEAFVHRGQEKGYFEFGGSTVILAFPEDRILLDDDIVKNSSEGIETIVHYGEGIGTANMKKEGENL